MEGSTTLRSRPMSARSCVIAAIATGAGALVNMGDSNSDCGSMRVVARPAEKQRKQGRRQFTKICKFIGEGRARALRSGNP